MQKKLTQALHLSVLGTFALSTDAGQTVLVRGNKVRALLVILASEPGIAHSRDALMSMLWPEIRQEAAQANLRQTMYRLRQAVPAASARSAESGEPIVPLLIADRLTVRINPVFF